MSIKKKILKSLEHIRAAGKRFLNALKELKNKFFGMQTKQANRHTSNTDDDDMLINCTCQGKSVQLPEVKEETLFPICDDPNETSYFSNRDTTWVVVFEAPCKVAGSRLDHILRNGDKKGQKLQLGEARQCSG